MSPTSAKKQAAEAEEVRQEVSENSGMVPQGGHEKQIQEEAIHKPQEEALDAGELLKQHGTKSAVIRILAEKGWTRSQIANFLGIRYQHVRAVLITPLSSANPAAGPTSPQQQKAESSTNQKSKDNDKSNNSDKAA